MDRGDDETAQAIVPVLACFLDQLCRQNENVQVVIEAANASHFFSVQPPAISVLDYLERIRKFARCSAECFVLALIYIDRMIYLTGGFVVNYYNIHRLLITSVMLAAKFFDDSYFDNAFFARVGGVQCHEINLMEVEFLFMVDFQLHGTMDVFQHYYKLLFTHSRQHTCGARGGALHHPMLYPLVAYRGNLEYLSPNSPAATHLLAYQHNTAIIQMQQQQIQQQQQQIEQQQQQQRESEQQQRLHQQREECAQQKTKDRKRVRARRSHDFGALPARGNVEASCAMLSYGETEEKREGEGYLYSPGLSGITYPSGEDRLSPGPFVARDDSISDYFHQEGAGPYTHTEGGMGMEWDVALGVGPSPGSVGDVSRVHSYKHSYPDKRERVSGHTYARANPPEGSVPASDYSQSYLQAASRGARMGRVCMS